jgi:MFS family permease
MNERRSTLSAFLSYESSIAKPGFNRWLIPPAAWAVNMSIGQVYAFSVFKIPLTRSIGVTHSASGDWNQPAIAWIFSLSIAILGLSAALFGRWVERAGPRRAMFIAALCFGSGFYLASLGVALHQLWLIYIGYGIVGGVGLGIGYITPVATLIKWFPDRPGLATGLAMVGFGGGAMIGSPLAVKLMQHFQTATDTGVLKTFLAMGTIYLAAMLLGAVVIRLPAPGWRPEGWHPKEVVAADGAGDVTASEALKLPQFWLLWAIICCNSIAGFGILEQASPMVQDLFSLGAVAGGGFVGVLSLFNMAGRSDYLGRKRTFYLFFAFGAVLYWVLPYTGANHFNSVIGFVIISGVLISMYGGGFSTIPAYAKDVFGSSHIGAIYGRLQTATATAGILGPIIVSYSREHQLAAGVSKSGAYQFVLHALIVLLLLGLVANLLVRPAAGKARRSQVLEEAKASISSSSKDLRLSPRTPRFVLATAWVLVLIPGIWGVYNTTLNAGKLVGSGSMANQAIHQAR